MKKNKAFIMLAIIGLTGVAVVSGCATVTSTTEKEAKLQQTQIFNIDGKTFVGVILLKSNGKIFAGYFRAKNGLVICPHFDIMAMNKAHIPAAMSGKWSKNTLQQGINEKIIKVNDLAKKKGVKKGMRVSEALVLLDK